MEFYFHEIDKDVLIVAIDGGLDGSTAPQLNEGIEKMIGAGMGKIIIDCSKLAFISSVGVGALLQLHRRMGRLGGDVKLAAARGVVFDVLKLTHLHGLFELYDDVDRARLAFRPRD